MPTGKLAVWGVTSRLVSTAPVAGFGNKLIYVSLTPGNLALDIGKITISGDSGGGTFDSFFDVWFDVHLGSINGAVIYQGNDQFTTTGSPWSSTAPPNAVGNGDFWPVGVIVHTANNGAHAVAAATTPLPATLPLFASGLTAAGLLAWRRKRKAQPTA